MRRTFRTFPLAMLLLAAPLGAQAKGGSRADSIPAAYMPPPGMCRVWIEGVPPDRQPAPTDCATAARNRPANGRVVFGDDKTASSRPRWRGADSTSKPRSNYADGPFRAGSAAGSSCVDRDRNGQCDETWARPSGALPALPATQSQSAVQATVRTDAEKKKPDEKP